MAVLAFCCTATAMFLYSELRKANAEVTFLNNDVRRHENKSKELANKLKRYEGVDFAQLRTFCSETAHDKFSKYISDNSIPQKNGLVTTFIPKNSGVLKEAQTTLDADIKLCNERYPV